MYWCTKFRSGALVSTMQQYIETCNYYLQKLHKITICRNCRKLLFAEIAENYYLQKLQKITICRNCRKLLFAEIAENYYLQKLQRKKTLLKMHWFQQCNSTHRLAITICRNCRGRRDIAENVAEIIRQRMAEVISQEFGGPLLKPLHGLLAMGGGGGGGWPPSKRIMFIYIYIYIYTQTIREKTLKTRYGLMFRIGCNWIHIPDPMCLPYN